MSRLLRSSAAIAAAASLLGACAPDNTPQTPPEYITSVNGCSLYRVRVKGETYPVFFTSCPGGTQQSIKHYCGKACWSDEERIVRTDIAQ